MMLTVLFSFLIKIIPLFQPPVVLQERPNIVWFVLEDTSPYQFGCYGNKDIQTPEVDRLAEQGIRYTRASANAPHCSPARSGLITGSYATTYGMDIHREEYETPADIFFPPYLREAGYFCTNNAKTDYNSTINDCDIWDECGESASYNSDARKPGQPFFSVFNTEATHMGLIRTITTEGRPDFRQFGIDPDNIFLPPHVPDLPEVRSDEAYMLKASRESGKWMQAYLDDLEEKGLADNTIVFFYGDHGGCLPRGKGFPFQTGLSMPLIIYVPPAWQKKLNIRPGTIDSSLISFVDFAPTVLSLAGIKPPSFMQGKPFLGKFAGNTPDLQFGFRSNQENYHYDPSRTVTDGRYKYIRNYIPHKPFALRNLYQWGMPANLAWDEYVMSGKCDNPDWLQPFQPKQAEMLFDLEKDPWELKNLAGDSAYSSRLEFFRSAVSRHLRNSKDLGLFFRESRDKPGGLFQWVRETDFPLEELYSAAELASMPSPSDTNILKTLLRSPYPEIRFWAASGFATLASQQKIRFSSNELSQAAKDEVPEIASAAAEALCYLGQADEGLQTLIRLFSENSNAAYSSLETLTWYPVEKRQMMPYVRKFKELQKEHLNETEDRMGLSQKIRSVLVNLGQIRLSELYTEKDKKQGIQKNIQGRAFRYPAARAKK